MYMIRSISFIIHVILFQFKAMSIALVLYAVLTSMRFPFISYAFLTELEIDERNLIRDSDFYLLYESMNPFCFIRSGRA